MLHCVFYRCILVLYYAVSGVNNVHIDLSGLSMRLLSFVHMCKDGMIMSFTYEVSCSGGCGISDVSSMHVVGVLQNIT